MTFSRQETCHYIATQAIELQRLAREANHPTLVHLFRMVQLEADDAEITEIKALRAACYVGGGAGTGGEGPLAPVAS